MKINNKLPKKLFKVIDAKTGIVLTVRAYTKGYVQKIYKNHKIVEVKNENES